MFSWPSQNSELRSLLRNIRRNASSVWASVQHAFSKSRTPIEQPICSDSAENNPCNERHRSQNIPRRPIRVIVERLPPPETPKHKRDAEKKKDRRPQWGILAVNVLTLAAVVIYAVITGKMWREMQNQTCIQRNAYVSAERAWVGLDGVPSVQMVLRNDGKYDASINFTLKDYGKGPALRVMGLAAITPTGQPRIVESTLDAQCNLIFPFVGLKPKSNVAFSPDLGGYQWGHVLFTNQGFGTSVGSLIDMPTLIGKEAYLVGCIVYRDQFSEPHWTKFCYNTGDFAKDVVKDPSSFSHLFICNANNYTDEVEKKPPSCPVTAN